MHEHNDMLCVCLCIVLVVLCVVWMCETDDGIYDWVCCVNVCV